MFTANTMSSAIEVGPMMMMVMMMMMRRRRRRRRMKLTHTKWLGAAYRRAVLRRL
jgi:uncharacterized protein involved in response to NO